MFNIPTTAKVICGPGHSLKHYPTDQRSQGSNLQPLVYKASGLSTTTQRLLEMENNVSKRLSKFSSSLQQQLFLNLILPINFSPENDVCSLCLLHIFKCTSDDMYFLSWKQTL